VILLKRTTEKRVKYRHTCRKSSSQSVPLGEGSCVTQNQTIQDLAGLSPELAAGIGQVKGAKKSGVRLGNWITATEARTLWQFPDVHTLNGNETRRCWQSCWAPVYVAGS
jgi:hypothetical protein